MSTPEAVAASSLQILPLFCLVLSKLNVRHTERDAEITSLAEDIYARGLKQNLVVVPAHFSTAEPGGMEAQPNISPGDLYEVIAGGRRYQALRLLADAGRIEHDFPVPVMVEARGMARETSLSENLHKVAMNPADEFAAFQVIVEQQIKLGEQEESAIAYTARRFGVTVKHVQGRLRLAALAPEILDALREGKITLDIAKAYAGTADHDLQRQVFKQASKHPYPLGARDIRSRLRGVTCAIDDPRMAFVGLDAFRAAGGRTESEMFMGSEGEERVVDVPLLEKLARAHGDKLAAEAAKAAGWKSGLFTLVSAYSVKVPEGFGLSYHGADQVSKTRSKQCIAVYGLARAEAEEPVKLEAFFEPRKAAEPVPAHDWKAEHRQRAREVAITRTAARLALFEVDGLFQGRVIWPDGFVKPIEDDDDEGFMLVAVQMRVPVAEIEAQREEATRAINAAAVKESLTADSDEEA